MTKEKQNYSLLTTCPALATVSVAVSILLFVFSAYYSDATKTVTNRLLVTLKPHLNPQLQSVHAHSCK